MVNAKDIEETVNRLVEKGNQIESDFINEVLKKITIQHKPHGGPFIILRGEYWWGKLDDEIRANQRKIRSDYQRWKTEARQLVELVITDDIDLFDEASEIIDEYMNLSNGGFCNNDKSERIKEYEDQFDTQINIISSITPPVIDRYFQLKKPNEERIR